jgi:hypothetical protein
LDFKLLNVHLLSESSLRLVLLFFQKQYVHFFCSSKRNEPKKRAPEMTNFVHTYARYTGLIGATVWPKFRAISGLPSHY